MTTPCLLSNYLRQIQPRNFCSLPYSIVIPNIAPLKISPLLMFLYPLYWHIFNIFSRPLYNIPLRSKYGTVRIQTHLNMQADGRSTSNPMLIRVSPLLVFLHTQYSHIWHIWSPVVKDSASLRVRHCAVARSLKHGSWWKIHLKTHVNQGFPFMNLSLTPIFPYLTYLVARCIIFRFAQRTALCGCKLT